jgi:hypothetical protein
MLLDPTAPLPVRPTPPLLIEGMPLAAPAWRDHGAPRAVRLLQHFQYGWLPPAIPVDRVEVIVPESPVLDGRALRSVLRLHLGQGEQAWHGDLLIVRPARTKRHVPVLAGLNFRGNHTTCADPAIPIHTAYVDGETPRGQQSGRWDFAQAIDAGIAVATMCLAEIHVDTTDTAIIDASHGINRFFGRTRQADRRPHAWGALAAWAWALQRIVDVLEEQPWADRQRIGAIGHSRLGKAALLATATDPRISLCIDNQSGTAGGALSRKSPDNEKAETLLQIARFTHWFCPAFFPFAGEPQRLPFDQHHLLAAIAPRPLLLNYAEEDIWGDPPDSFRCAQLAEPAWAAFGHAPALPATQPGVNTLVGDRLAWHYRPGKHDVTPVDWSLYLRFCARWWA